MNREMWIMVLLGWMGAGRGGRQLRLSDITSTPWGSTDLLYNPAGRSDGEMLGTTKG